MVTNGSKILVLSLDLEPGDYIHVANIFEASSNDKTRWCFVCLQAEDMPNYKQIL